MPSFDGTSEHQVSVILQGVVKSPAFVRFLERLGQETVKSFSTDDFLTLDAVHRDAPLIDRHRDRLPGLIQVGALETIGRGRGTRYLLSKRFYAALGQRAAYTRRRGLDRETNKALLLQHLSGQAEVGAALSELRQVLPSESEGAVQALLNELRQEGKVVLRGSRRWARWFAANR